MAAITVFPILSECIPYPGVDSSSLETDKKKRIGQRIEKVYNIKQFYYITIIYIMNKYTT